jgi:hypothetical protein
MESDVLWKAAMEPRLPTGLGKRPPHARPRFPQLPQPLLRRKKINHGKPNAAAPPIKCYLCSRSKVLPMFQVAQPKAGEGPVSSQGEAIILPI